MAPSSEAVRDPGLQPERTALSWRRTIMSAVVASILIWRGWFHSLTGEGAGGALSAGALPAGGSTQVVGLGICAAIACLTTITLVVCAVVRIRLLHAGVAALKPGAQLGVPTLILRTASAAIVALAAATVCALALGM